MQLDKDLISRLEKLARLQLSASEREKFAADLTSILNMVDKLQELDTSEIEPLTYPTPGNMDLRTDQVGSQLSQKEALKNAPNHDDQYFRVPKVID